MNYKTNKWNEFVISNLSKFYPDVYVFTPSIYREYRGEIFTTFHTEEHPAMDTDIVHENLSRMSIHDRFSKSYKGVLRGMHYDDKTWKLVQSVVGEIYLVVLDIRPNSPTYGVWEQYILSEKTRDQVLIPAGFACGHYAITDCLFHYTLFYNGNFVDESKQGVIKWNDPKFNIEWPTNNPILQNRDR